VHNFGRLLEGQSATHTFRFQNVGDKSLVIDKVSTTCGCTAALVSDSIIDPGEKGEIKATFNSRGRMGFQNKSISVRSNDPEQTLVKLAIKGEVYVLLRVSPRSLNFGDVPKGKSKTMTAKVTPWGGTKFEIVEIEPPGPEFEVRVVGPTDLPRLWEKALKTARENLIRKFGSREARSGLLVKDRPAKLEEFGADVEEARTVSVTLLPSAQIGSHSGRMKIHTNLEEKPVLDVPIYAKVVGDIKVEPRSYNFGVIRRGETKESIFTISSTQRRILKIRKVENNCEHATVELSEVEPRTKYQLRVAISPDAPVGRLYGTATLHTNDPDQPEVRVRFYADVREQ
ncbi:MAG: DUF1573 domain-containing protein, partial [bacterium]